MLPGGWEAAVVRMGTAARGATFDPSGVYRYRLWRRWAAGLPVLFILLNPSTADARRDDPTVRRCAAFARRWGFGAVEVVNLFALRSTAPQALWEAADPVGPANDRQIRAAARRARRIVAGWGAPRGGGPVSARAAAVAAALGPAHPLLCLGRTASGAPRHPLYLPAPTPPEPWGPEGSGQRRGPVRQPATAHHSRPSSPRPSQPPGVIATESSNFTWPTPARRISVSSDRTMPASRGRSGVDVT